MKILLFRFSALGDVALTVPVVESLARQYPNDEFVVVSRPFVAPLFANLGDNLSFRGVNLNAYKGLRGLLCLANELRRETKADAVADLHDVLRTQVLRTLLRLMGLRVATIDKGRKEKHRLVSGEERHALKHVTMRYAEVLDKLGRKVEVNFQKLNVLPLCAKPKQAQWVGVAPFAAHRGKIYPPAQMYQAVAMLLERHPMLEVFLFGSRDEMENIRSPWMKPRLRFVCDEVKGLGDELRLMGQLDAMVSMDSANLHLASLVKIPVVSLWGATHPYAGFTGYGQATEDALQLDLPCRPCSIYGNRSCAFGDYHCLTNIAPQDIVSAVERHLFTEDHARMEENEKE